MNNLRFWLAKPPDLNLIQNVVVSFSSHFGRGPKSGNGFGVADQVGCYVKEKRRLQSANEVESRLRNGGGEVEGQDVHHAHDAMGANGRQRFQVWLRAVGREHDGLADPCALFPRRDKFVHDPVQCLAGKRGDSGSGLIPARVDAEGNCGGAGNSGPSREIVGEAVEDDGVGAEREMGATQLESPRRKDEPPGFLEALARCSRMQAFES